MSGNILRFCRRLLIVAALLPFGIQLASAGNAPVISGSYRVVQNRSLGAQVQIRMRIHLMNSGAADLSIQRMTVWDSSHAAKGGSLPCAVTLRGHASADTIQEFTVLRSDYQRWQKGFRPRFVLQIAGAGKSAGRPAELKTTTVVRLGRGSEKEGQ
jgi:hypothetical protein